MGILWELVSALAYAVLSLTNRYLSGRYEARTVCLYEQSAAAVVLLPTLIFSRVAWTFQNFAGIATIGQVCTVLAHFLYVKARAIYKL